MKLDNKISNFTSNFTSKFNDYLNTNIFSSKNTNIKYNIIDKKYVNFNCCLTKIKNLHSTEDFPYFHYFFKLIISEFP